MSAVCPPKAENNPAVSIITYSSWQNVQNSNMVWSVVKKPEVTLTRVPLRVQLLYDMRGVCVSHLPAFILTSW